MSMIQWLRRLAGSDPQPSSAPAAAPPTFMASMPPPNASAQEEQDMVVAGLDFFDAIKAHQRWKSRLVAQLNGTATETLDYRVLCRDDQCTLGRWINGPGAERHGSLSAFNLLKVSHAQFHLAAGQVMRDHQEGKTKEAQEALRHGEYAQHSVKVQGLISALYLEVKRSG